MNKNNKKTHKQASSEKYFALKSGYDQHTNPHRIPTIFEQEIIQVIWELQKQGLSPYTIRNIDKRPKVLAKHYNLNNPEIVRGFIAQFDRKDGYNRGLCYAYGKYTSSRHKRE
jgi:hypothetical protein